MQLNWIFIIVTGVVSVVFAKRWYNSLQKSTQTPYNSPLFVGRSILFFCAFLCFVVSSWFISEISETEQTNNDIVIMLDVSQSMLVEDMGSGRSRLAYTKEKINQLLMKIPNARWGLTIFAGETQSILPLTHDISLFSTFLAGVDHRNLTKQGTQLVEATRESIQRFDLSNNNKKTLLIFTDGGDENIQGDEQLKTLLTDDGIQIFILGIGTQQGGPIPEGIDLFGNKITKQRQNQTVISTLQEQPLRTLATILGGKYIQGKDDLYSHLEGSFATGIGGSYSGGISTFFLILGTICFLFALSTHWIGARKRKQLFAFFLSNDKK